MVVLRISTVDLSRISWSTAKDNILYDSQNALNCCRGPSPLFINVPSNGNESMTYNIGTRYPTMGLLFGNGILPYIDSTFVATHFGRSTSSPPKCERKIKVLAVKGHTHLQHVTQTAESLLLRPQHKSASTCMQRYCTLNSVVSHLWQPKCM